MKTVLTGMCNSLMEESIRHALQKDNGFSVVPVKGSMADAGSGADADIVLLEVACNPGFSVDEQLRQVRLLRSRNPRCRILLICDENSTPELARKVAIAKKDGLIDDFLYSSVSESYLTAMLYAI